MESVIRDIWVRVSVLESMPEDTMEEMVDKVILFFAIKEEIESLPEDVREAVLSSRRSDIKEENA